MFFTVSTDISYFLQYILINQNLSRHFTWQLLFSPNLESRKSTKESFSVTIKLFQRTTPMCVHRWQPGFCRQLICWFFSMTEISHHLLAGSLWNAYRDTGQRASADMGDSLASPWVRKKEGKLTWQSPDFSFPIIFSCILCWALNEKYLHTHTHTTVMATWNLNLFQSCLQIFSRHHDTHFELQC